MPGTDFWYGNQDVPSGTKNANRPTEDPNDLAGDGNGGEVSQGDLENAINFQTSNNTDGVSTLGISISGPPSQGDVQSIVDKLDELINALKR